MASIDRRGDQMAIKFYDDTPIGPEQLVKLLRKRRGMRLDPTGRAMAGLEEHPRRADGCHQKRIATTTIVGIKFEAGDSMKSCKFVSVLSLGGALMLGAVLLPAGARAQTKSVVVEEIIARVNNDIITMSDYQKAEEQLREEVAHDCQGCPQDKVMTEFKDQQKDLLRGLIDQSLDGAARERYGHQRGIRRDQASR